MLSTIEETKEIAQVRGNVYSLLSQCFFQPSEELATSITKGSLNEALQGTVGMVEGEEVERELARIKEFGAKCQERPHQEVLKDMKVEYNRLFVGPGHVAAPPYESVYKTRNADNEIGVVMGDAAIAVKRFYRQAGIELSDGFKDLPDHIAVELQFMAHLCSLEAESQEDGKDSLNSMQAKFLTEHLGSWIADFSHAVCHSMHSDFYCSIARLAEVWVKFELDALQY